MANCVFTYLFLNIFTFYKRGIFNVHYQTECERDMQTLDNVSCTNLLVFLYRTCCKVKLDLCTSVTSFRFSLQISQKDEISRLFLMIIRYFT